MSVDLRELRCLVAIADEGSFTDAAIELGMSQATVSRTLASLEATLGSRLVRRTTRSSELTDAGERAVRHARRILASVDELERDVSSGDGIVRLGYAWSALGKHTVGFLREWATRHPLVDMQLVRSNTPTAGLAEGLASLAIVRRAPDPREYDVVLVGLERRYCALASDDPLASRRSLTLAQVATRPLAIDSRTGSTVLDLWAPTEVPTHVIETHDIEDWLVLIGSGRAVGMTAEATVHQYRRPGIVYRLVRDAPSIAVYLAWTRGDAPRERDAVVELLAELYRT